MSLAKMRCPDLAEVDHYFDEATRLLCDAERRLLQLHRDESCENVQQTSADLIAAMKRIHRMIEDYRDALIRNAVALPRMNPAPETRREWSFLLWLRAQTGQCPAAIRIAGIGAAGTDGAAEIRAGQALGGQPGRERGRVGRASKNRPGWPRKSGMPDGPVSAFGDRQRRVTSTARPDCDLHHRRNSGEPLFAPLACEPVGSEARRIVRRRRDPGRMTGGPASRRFDRHCSGASG